MNDLRRVVKTYQDIKLLYNGLRFSLLPFALIGLGISQLVYGWMGDTVVLRYVYPALCIGIGLIIIFVVVAFLWLTRETPVHKGSVTETLRRIASERYGPFEATPELRDELLLLNRKSFLWYKRRVGELPDSGDELCDYVKASPKVAAFLKAEAARRS